MSTTQKAIVDKGGRIRFVKFAHRYTKLAVDKSFYVPKKDAPSLRSILTRYSQETGKIFVTKTTNRGLRVTRWR